MVFDLQLFAGEKTEPATEKRREEARAQGNILKSQDLESVVVLIVAFYTLSYYAPQIFGELAQFMRYALGPALASELSVKTVNIFFMQMMWVTLKVSGPILFMILLAAVLYGYWQNGGFQFSLEMFSPDLSRMNPFSGLENLFSGKNLWELVKSVFKVIVVGYVPYYTLQEQMPLVLRLMKLEPMPGMILFLGALFVMIKRILFVLFILAIGDWYFQEWRYEESLKMSKEEIKDEYKQREGDPKVKSKIRERQRRAATRRMMEEVPKATVVVTNPTHIAVALRYDEQSGSAPTVVAMGTGLIAEKIKQVAREHGVPVIENKPLARTLHEMVDVGDEIPQDLYLTVAEILAQVMRMKMKAA